MASTHVRSAAEIARLVRAAEAPGVPGGCGESAFALYKHYNTVAKGLDIGDNDLWLSST
jgi:hypothetical protein